MTTKEFIAYIQKNVNELEKLRKKLKPAKSLEAFFAELNKKKKAS